MRCFTCHGTGEIDVFTLIDKKKLVYRLMTEFPYMPYREIAVRSNLNISTVHDYAKQLGLTKKHAEFVKKARFYTISEEDKQYDDIN